MAPNQIEFMKTIRQGFDSKPNSIRNESKKKHFCVFLAWKSFNFGGEILELWFCFHYMFSKQVVSALYPRFMHVGISRYISEICLLGSTCSNWWLKLGSLVLCVCLYFILPLLLLSGWSPVSLGLISILAKFATFHISAWNRHGSPRF